MLAGEAGGPQEGRLLFGEGQGLLRVSGGFLSPYGPRRGSLGPPVLQPGEGSRRQGENRQGDQEVLGHDSMYSGGTHAARLSQNDAASLENTLNIGSRFTSIADAIASST